MIRYWGPRNGRSGRRHRPTAGGAHPGQQLHLRRHRRGGGREQPARPSAGRQPAARPGRRFRCGSDPALGDTTGRSSPWPPRRPTSSRRVTRPSSSPSGGSMATRSPSVSSRMPPSDLIDAVEAEVARLPDLRPTGPLCAGRTRRARRGAEHGRLRRRRERARPPLGPRGALKVITSLKGRAREPSCTSRPATPITGSAPSGPGKVSGVCSSCTPRTSMPTLAAMTTSEESCSPRSTRPTSSPRRQLGPHPRPVARSSGPEWIRSPSSTCFQEPTATRPTRTASRASRSTRVTRPSSWSPRSLRLTAE